MNKKKRISYSKVISVVVVMVTTLILLSTNALAAEDRPTIELQYYDELVVSAYYPAEDAEHPNNYKGIPLSNLVDEIVAVPTGIELLGKHILIEYEQDNEIKYMLRKVGDTGCTSGRIDLLMADESAMNNWGLRTARIYVIENDDTE